MRARSKIMLNFKILKKYYSDKRVLITGHTGFKGSYMCVLLNYLGAKVYGYSLRPEKNSLYDYISKGSYKNVVAVSHASPIVAGETFADIRDTKKLTAFMKKVKPDYILHMAAQPLVLRGYEEPAYTYDVNVMGTVSLMEAIRSVYGVKINDSSKADDRNGSKVNIRNEHGRFCTGELCEPISILNVTTDKVYENNDLFNYAFKESDKLCGRDPYANSKSCSELVTYAYKKSFFNDERYFRVSTARAGNVIGGGDLNKDRIIPDCYRAIKVKKDIFVRNPYSIRPYQYVLEPLIIYLNIMAYQKKAVKYVGSYNVGPDKKDCLTTKALVEKFFEAYSKIESPLRSTKIIYNRSKNITSKHEAVSLRLDNKLIKKMFGYKEIFNMEETIEYTTTIYDLMLKAGTNKKMFSNQYIKYMHAIFDSL